MPDTWAGRAVARLLLISVLGGCLACLHAAGSAQALPAGWGYELVSPPDTHGVSIAGMSVAPDGDHAWVGAVLPITPEQNSGNVVDYAARRTATGWVLRDMSEVGGDRAALEARSADGTRSIISFCNAVLLGCLTGSFRLERVDEDGTRTALLNTPYEYPNREPTVVGASDDVSRVIVRNFPEAGPLVPEDTHTSGGGLYSVHDGSVEYLGIDENGLVLPCGAVVADGQPGVNNGNGTGFEQSGVSADGSTVAFESPDSDSGCPKPVDVYVRRDGVSVNVSHPETGTDHGAEFVGATRDGNVTYFETTNQLVSSDTDTNKDIYTYDWTTGTRERISVGVGVFTRYVVVSPGGEYAYFMSTQSLDGQGVDGAKNLYVYHAGTIRFIASGPSNSLLIGGSVRGGKPTYTTPDGTRILFTSTDPLTSGLVTGGTQQILQYDVARDVMTCVSCPPDGSVPTANSFLSGLQPAGNADARHQSDDGTAVAFTTTQALVAGDANGAVADVYLWREGKPLELISGGHGDDASTFQGMSADGKSVFFQSSERLLPGIDQDSVKAYVARAGGGFPPGTVTPRCTDDACEGLLMPPPSFSPPASEMLGKAGKRVQGPSKLTRITLGKLRHAQREIIRTGALPLALRVNGAGKLVVVMTARIGRTWRKADQVRRPLHHAGAVHITLRLSTRVRAYLAISGILRIHITARSGSAAAESSVVLRMR